MGEMDDNFKNKVKTAFSKVKEDISSMKEDLKDIKALTTNDSIGSEGVYSFIHSFMHKLDKPMNSQISKITQISSDLGSLLGTLTKQELLVILTIYQYEEDKKAPITYYELSEALKLSQGCIRTYISSILRKGIPLSKLRINNKITTVSVDESLRNLKLKQKLVDLYYRNDPNQARLTDI